METIQFSFRIVPVNSGYYIMEQTKLTYQYYHSLFHNYHLVPDIWDLISRLGSCEFATGKIGGHC